MGWLMNLMLKSAESPAMEGMEAEHILATYRSVETTLERMKRGMAESDVKQEMEAIKARLKFHADLAVSRDRLRESAGKDRRTQLQAMAQVESALVRSMSDLAQKGWQKNGRAVQRFLEGRGGGSSPEDYRAGLAALYGSYFEGGGDLSSTDPGLVATMREVKRLIAEQVGQTDEDKKAILESEWVVRDAEGKIVDGVLHRIGVTDDATIGNITGLADNAASQESERTRAQVEIDKELDTIRDLRSQVEALPEDADASGLLADAQGRYKKISEGLADDLSGDTQPAMLTRYAEYEGQEKAVQRMEKLADSLAMQVMGGAPSAREQAAKIIMDPNFRRWAGENGYTELGLGTWDEAGRFIGYAPGRDDARAMLLANWQMKHPSPHIWPKTGKLVEVTVQEPDPAAAPYIDPETGLVAYIETEQGRQRLMPAEALERKTERRDLAEMAFAAGTSYLREGTRTLVYDGSGWKDFEGVLPEGLQWMPAGIQDQDGIRTAPMSEVAAAPPENAYMFTPEDAALWDVKSEAPSTIAKVYRGEMTKSRWSPQGYKPGALLTDVEGGMLDVEGLRAKGIAVNVVEKGEVPRRAKAPGPAPLGGRMAARRYERLAGEGEKPKAEEGTAAYLPPEATAPEAEEPKLTDVEARKKAVKERQQAERRGRKDEAEARVAAAGREARRQEIGAAGLRPGILGAPVGGVGAPSVAAVEAPGVAPALPPSATQTPETAVGARTTPPVVKNRPPQRLPGVTGGGKKQEGELPTAGVAKPEKTPEQIQAKPPVGLVSTPEMEARLKAMQEKREKLKGAMQTLEEGLAPVETR